MASWTRRLEESEGGILAAAALMGKTNPLFIPRNYFVEKALAGADENNYTLFKQLLSLVKQPYSSSNETEKYSYVPNNYDHNYKTYCGT